MGNQFNKKMDNQFTFDKNDRIVEINGFEIFVHDDHRFNRRNVICYSNKLQLYIMLNRLKNNNAQHSIIIGGLLSKNTFDDIKVIGIRGYY